MMFLKEQKVKRKKSGLLYFSVLFVLLSTFDGSDYYSSVKIQVRFEYIT